MTGPADAGRAGDSLGVVKTEHRMDAGGCLTPGLTQAVNETGHPERVLNVRNDPAADTDGSREGPDERDARPRPDQG